MASIRINIDDEQLTFNNASNEQVSIPLRSDVTEVEKVTIWKDEVSATKVGGPISEWLSDTLNYKKGPLKLMKFSDKTSRLVGEKYLPKQDSSVSFADACPYLFTFNESLDALNQQLPKPMPMDRFRANIVFSGAPAWHEYQWQEVKNEQVSFGLIGPCQRCQMTSIDQDNGSIVTPGEPLKTLMQHFPVKGKKVPYFGQHARLLAGQNETLHIGQTFTII